MTAAAEKHLLLGIEGGASRTVAIMADGDGRLVKRVEGGPANLRLLNDAQLLGHLKSIAKALPKPSAVAIGMAGARTEQDFKKIRSAAGKVWGSVPCYATGDLETALAAGTNKANEAMTRVLALSGTGSCFYGQSPDGKTAKVGGWGHILGDEGSGYEIGLRTLKATVYHFDRGDKFSIFGARVLHRLQLNEPNDLIGWVAAAKKPDIAALAPEVFAAAERGDKSSLDVLAAAARRLAEAGLACAHKLAKPKTPVHFILAGSVLLKQPKFRASVARQLRQGWPGGVVSHLERESAWGAVELARKVFGKKNDDLPSIKAPPLPGPLLHSVEEREKKAPEETQLSKLAKLSPTEQRNPRSRNLDRLPTLKAVELMLSEDAKIPAAVLVERKKIARGVELIARAFKTGGRLFYVGAGTSGRLGVLDASECPPTFRSDPELVQGIMAGGQSALWRSVEGAEDDPEAGARAIEFRNVTRRDVVVGIAASGRTPFVWGALRGAKKRGAKTIMLAFNPWLEIPRDARPALVITPNLGPEILTGSTRLKSGTATKLILNIFTTLAMVKIGKVVSNLMVDLNPSNIKLRDRAVRIVRELTGVEREAAESALKNSGWVIKRAITRINLGNLSLEKGRARR